MKTQDNAPHLWLSQIPRPDPDGHKYNRGHALIYGAPELTGASRLAAESCARMGAGLVTVVGGKKSDVYRASLPAHILVRDRVPEDQSKITAMLIGPGGVPKTCKIEAARKRFYGLVVDADAIGKKYDLYANCVLTPHEGEFAKAFPTVRGTREERASAAAKISGAIIVLKGPGTVIAHPDERITVNPHRVAGLAPAGAGDVLAGMIAGLMAQGMSPYESAAAAVWIHAEAGSRSGPGLVASDLPGIIPFILAELFQ